MKRGIFLILVLLGSLLFLQQREPTDNKTVKELAFEQDSPVLDGVIFAMVVSVSHYSELVAWIKPHAIEVPKLHDGYVIVEDKPPVMNMAMLQTIIKEQTLVKDFDFSCSNKLLNIRS